MSYTTSNGRLCNQLIRNLALSFIAKKHDLYVEYINDEQIASLGIVCFVGNKKYNTTKVIMNHDFMALFTSNETIDYNLDFNQDYFQTNEITSLIYNHLRSENIKEGIIEKNRYNDRYNNNNDLFIHIRLGDVTRFNHLLNFYLYLITTVTYDKLYITTEPYHINDTMMTTIKEKHANAIIIEYNEIDTIHFGSTCKHVGLSHGTFSAIIGYLSFDSIVYYADTDPKWCSIEPFLNNGWTGIIPDIYANHHFL